MEKIDKPLILSLFFIILVFALIILLNIGRLDNFSFYNIILYLIASPFIEELFFRHYVQSFFYKKYEYKYFFITFANVLSSSLFVLCHILLVSKGLYGLIYFIPSIFLGIIYDRYKSLYINIFIHSILNINAFIIYH